MIASGITGSARPNSGRRPGRGMRRALGLLLAATALSACQEDGLFGSGSGSGTSFNFDPGIFSTAYVTSFSAYESLAESLRNSARYKVQEITWTDGTRNYHSDSLDNANVEYAQAVGLSGAGQIISIVDAGFLQSHQEFSGKQIWTPSGYAPGVDDHGTHVASIAAGSANVGQIVGVAPGADLALGAFDTIPSIIAANDQARQLGAIVQNNSWGVTDDYGNERSITQADFNAVFSGYWGGAWYDSIKALSQNTVIVQAASNDTTRSSADLLSALPALRPELAGSWVAVINAVPTHDAGGNIVSASIVSSRCLEAAPWCIAADGFNLGASASGNTAYASGGGTSYAAPQVAGAIAILAEAFPQLSAQELRARLLASANNGFYKHDGYIQFAPGIVHGYSTDLGHGFLDLKAALLPIGGSYVPLSSGGAMRVDSPVLMAGGAVGDGLRKRLQNQEMLVLDGLGAQFTRPASLLAGQSVAGADPLARLDAQLAVSLDGAHLDPFRIHDPFAGYMGGRELGFGVDEMQISLLLPGRGGERATSGIALSRRVWRGEGGAALSFGLSALHEGSGFSGLQSLMPGSPLRGDHLRADLALDMPLDGRTALTVSGRFGIAAPGGEIADMRLGPVSYNAMNLGIDRRGVFGRSDRLSLAVSLPQAVRSGTARVNLPTTLESGQPVFRQLEMPLAPLARQVDLSLAYGVPLGEDAEMIFSARQMRNNGNIAGRRGAEIALTFSIGF